MAFLAVVAACSLVACGSGAPSAHGTMSTPSAPATSPPISAPGNAHGSFTFSGWLTATNVGPVQPLPFAVVAGAVPAIPLAEDTSGHLQTGAAPGTQCLHASSQTNIDQYTARLVFLVAGRNYLLAISAAFERPGVRLGEATAPAGGRMTDVAGNSDELRFDMESAPLGSDPMFVASFSDGSVVISPNLRAGSIDVTLTGLPLAGGAIPSVHVSGTWVCP